jgi:hypothetical protein
MPTSVSTLLHISSELDIIGDVTAVLTGDDHRPFWAALLPEGDLAAGAVHTVPEHLASPHADHHSWPQDSHPRLAHGESSPSRPITVRPPTRSWSTSSTDSPHRSLLAR